ncbi:MAG TPA: MSMEG_4193 family putative phosphomutase [Actinomycetota bacterium]|nr:MSMEG_4193 family putative phosphomutase [Actinomycetota bacterium]
MTTFFFVRHAVTAHTGKKLSGWLEGIPLTEQGREQAARVAEALAEVPLKAVYSSPIDRTTETADAIARRHGLKVKVSRGLGEVRYGDWTDRSLKVLARTKLWSKVQRWPSGARFPNGESLREVQARALTEVERLVEQHGGETICCVSHGDVIKLVLAHYLGVHIDLFQRIVIAPASISVISVSDRGPLILSMNGMPMAIPPTKDQ